MATNGIGHTPNLDLSLLPENYRVWAQIMNDNLTTIDAAINGFVQYSNFRGPWSNSTHYAVGDTVVDTSTATIWTNSTVHTSAQIPTTFAEDRAAHPSYWIASSSAASNRGAWTGPGTVYNVNDFVLADGHKYAMALVQHVSSNTFEADRALGYWEVIIDFSEAGSSVPSSPTPPLAPVTNQMWWNSDLGQLFIWYNDGTSTQWVPATPVGASVTGGSDFIAPGMFGAVGDGIANDTVAVSSAAIAAVSAGVWLDGGDKWYGVSELVLPVNLKMRDIKFKELDPQGYNQRRTVRCIGTGAASERFTAINFVVNRNGDGTVGLLNYSAGMWVQNVNQIHLKGEIYGDGIGSGIVMDAIKGGFVDLYTHHIHYFHTVEIDDTVHGIWFRNGCKFITGYCRAEYMGRTDQTSNDRDQFSRGIAYSNCENMSIWHNAYRVDQGCDVTGSGGNNSVSLAGKYSHCRGVGAKVANSAVACDYNRVTAEHCGVCGLIVGAPPVIISNMTQNNMISGVVVRNTGTNQGASAVTPTTIAIRIDRNSADPYQGTFPKGIFVNDFVVTSDIGSATFTADTSNNWLTLITSAPGYAMPTSTGVRVRLTTTGTLPGPLLVGTDYWIIDVPDSMNVRLASSFINAEDGVYIGLGPGAGTGTNTITLQSDCDYAVSCQEATYSDPLQPNVLGTGYVSGMLLGVMQSSNTMKLAHRELLYADRTYYVRTDGVDANSGLVDSAAGAFKTISYALNYIDRALDLGNFDVTVQVADGTYAGSTANLSGPFVGGGTVTVKGNVATPSNVVFSSTADCFSLSNRVRLRVTDMKITSSGGSCFSVNSNANVEFGNVEFGAATARHVSATTGAVVTAISNYAISGGAVQHVVASTGAQVSIASRTVTLSGTPAFSTAFVSADRGAVISADSTTFPGTGATGTRYVVNSNGVIFTNGGGATYFPGSIAGTAATGGQYI